MASPTLLAPPAAPAAPAARPISTAREPANPHRPSTLAGEPSQVRAMLGFGGWILLGCFAISFLNTAPPWVNPVEFGVSFAYSLVYFVGLWLANAYTADLLNLRTSWNERPVRRLLLTLGLSLLASLAVILLVGEAFSVLLWHHDVLHIFRRNLVGQLLFPLVMTVVISLFMHSRSFLLAWREAAVRAEQFEKEAAVARLDSLRRQVDPHFLFNSLNALTSLVEEADPARAVRFIRQLSGVYRYVLDSQSQELVPLSEELAFAEAYIFLQKTRLGDALDFELTHSLTHSFTHSLHLPPLALQLLLENALKHNTAFQADPLRLRVTVDEAARTLTVRNTLRPRRLSADEASGRGLANLRARYGFLTSQPVQAGPVAGEFVVVLPLLSL